MKYIKGYFIFASGVLAFYLIGAAIFGTGNYEMGFAGTFYVNTLFGALSYIAGIFILSFLNSFQIFKIKFTEPDTYFGYWAFSLGLLNTAIPEVVNILLEGYDNAFSYMAEDVPALVLLAPIVVSSVYIAIRIYIRHKNKN